MPSTAQNSRHSAPTSLLTPARTYRFPIQAEDSTACSSVQDADCSWSDSLSSCVATAVAQFNASELSDFNTQLQQMDASVWGDCSNAVAYERMVSACGQMSDYPINQTECEAYGGDCMWWTDAGVCRTTDASILKAAFNLSATHPAALADTACLNATTNATCTAIGNSFTFQVSDLLGLKDNNFTLVDTSSNLQGGSISDGNSTSTTTTTAQTGGAAAKSGMLAAAYSSLLLVILLL